MAHVQRLSPALTEGSRRHLEDVAALDRAHSPVMRSANRYASFLGDGGTVMLATGGPALQGFAAMSVVLDEGTLLNIVVAPHARQSGVATALLNAVIAEARRQSLRRLLLEAREGNRAALALYRAAGFRRDTLRPRYYPARDGQPAEAAVLMSLSLEN